MYSTAIDEIKYLQYVNNIVFIQWIWQGNVTTISLHFYTYFATNLKGTRDISILVRFTSFYIMGGGDKKVTRIDIFSHGAFCKNSRHNLKIIWNSIIKFKATNPCHLILSTWMDHMLADRLLLIMKMTEGTANKLYYIIFPNTHFDLGHLVTKDRGLCSSSSNCHFVDTRTSRNPFYKVREPFSPRDNSFPAYSKAICRCSHWRIRLFHNGNGKPRSN